MKKLMTAILMGFVMLMSGCGDKPADKEQTILEQAKDPAMAAKIFYQNLVDGDLAIARQLAMPGVDVLRVKHRNGWLRDPSKVNIRTELIDQKGNMARVYIWFTDKQPQPATAYMYFDGGVWKFKDLV